VRVCVSGVAWCSRNGASAMWCGEACGIWRHGNGNERSGDRDGVRGMYLDMCDAVRE
jgi:hypothetical protein